MLELYVSTRIRMNALLAKLTEERGSDTTEKAMMIGGAAAIAGILVVAVTAFVQGKIGSWR